MFTTKLATAAVTGVLSLAVTGAAAFAAFQPADTAAITASIDGGSQASVQDQEGKEKDKDKDRDKGDALKAVLDRLVANGTITQAQEEAILKAVKEAGKRHDDGAGIVKRILADLMKLSVNYLGIDREELARQLKAGKSLGEIANATPGKSKEGLITYLVAQVSAQLDQAVAEGKITKERADEAKKGLVEHVTRFVDHKYERKPEAAKREKRPTTAGEKRPETAPKPTPTPTAKPTT